MQEFKVGDLVQAEGVVDLMGLIGEVKEVSQYHCVVDFDKLPTWCREWKLQKRSLFHFADNKTTHPEKQISIERIGDKTSVTISGHLTKDDVQSILNLIFL